MLARSQGAPDAPGRRRGRHRRRPARPSVHVAGSSRPPWSAWCRSVASTGNRRRMAQSACLTDRRSRTGDRLDGCVVLHRLPAAQSPIADAAPLSLCAREPHVPADRLVAEMVPPPRFDSVPLRHLRPGPGAAQPDRGGAGPERLRGRARRRARGGPGKRRWFAKKPAAPTGPARRLPGRRLRRRQDPPARLAVARHPGRRRAQGVRHLRRADQPRRRARLPADRAHAQRAPAAVHRRVRAGRPGRHRPGLHPARQARRRRASRSPRPPTRCPASSARAGSPPPTSCARSRACPRTSARCASTARTTATAACPRRPPRTPTSRSPGRRTRTPGASLDDFPALLDHLAHGAPQPLRRAVRRRRRRSA